VLIWYERVTQTWQLNGYTLRCEWLHISSLSL